MPTKTLVIDLTQTEDKLWKNLSQDARQSVRKTLRSRLNVKSYQPADKEFDNALYGFHKLLSESGKRGGFWATPLKDLKLKARAFGKGAIIFLAFQAGSPKPAPLAGAFVFLSGETAFFHHIGSSKEGQKLFAPYILIWEIIRYLKTKKKIRRLDLEGIADPRFPQTEKWEGFTVFKRKWGGKEFEYPAPLIKYYHLPVKILFTLAQTLNRALVRS